MIWIAAALTLLFFKKYRKNAFMLMGGLASSSICRSVIPTEGFHVFVRTTCSPFVL